METKKAIKDLARSRGWTYRYAAPGRPWVHSQIRWTCRRDHTWEATYQEASEQKGCPFCLLKGGPLQVAVQAFGAARVAEALEWEEHQVAHRVRTPKRRLTLAEARALNELIRPILPSIARREAPEDVPDGGIQAKGRRRLPPKKARCQVSWRQGIIA